MSFFNPETAPAVHLEPLPLQTIAAKVSYGPLKFSKDQDADDCLVITAWVPGKDMSTVDDGDADDFYENYCSRCSYNTDEYEYDADGEEFHVEDEEVIIRGSITTTSPCPCYAQGLEEVDFPCPAGYDGPEEHESDQVLTAHYMVYAAGYRNGLIVWNQAYQQGIRFGDNQIYGTDQFKAINTFDNSTICWGDNTSPGALADVVDAFNRSPCNQDLLSFEAHNENATDCHDNDRDTPIANAFPVNHLNGRQTAVVCATARDNANAFVLLAASGCHLQDNVAIVGTQLYRNVAIDDDTILDVWASEVTPVGKRLLFYRYDESEGGAEGDAVYLGQVPQDFNLEPCLSLVVPSSEPVAQDKISCQALSAC